MRDKIKVVNTSLAYKRNYGLCARQLCSRALPQVLPHKDPFKRLPGNNIVYH